MESKNSTFHEEKSILAKAIHEFLNASNLSKMRQILEQYPELLSEEAESMLEAICKSAPSEEAIELVQDYRDFLAHCREVGIDQAFENTLSSSRKVENLMEVIEIFLSTSNAIDTRRILEHHPELLSEKVDSMLAALYVKAQKEEIIIAIQFRRNLLSRCREVGIAQAFEEISRFFNETPGIDLEMIFEEIVNLSSLQDIPRKIMLLQYALSLISRQSNPEQWAFLQLDLVDSLGRNHQGNLGDNIEQIFRHCTQALEIFTYQNYPIQWAVIQHHLANAYSIRIQGDMADNIEKAIEYYNQSLKVRTQEDFPVNWATAQNNLALAYSNRIRGDKGDNIEKAIEYYKQALVIFLHQDFPVGWAMLQSNLAAAYLKRIQGDKAENIELAIEYCNKALEVYTNHEFPDKYAGNLHNLATAYKDRIRGDRADNIEKAIELYNLSLEVYEKHTFPEEWADTQNNLGLAYWNRIRGDKADNIEKSIDHYNLALSVRTYEDFPVKWAEIHNNLSNAYCDRIKGHPAENLEQAIKNFNLVLKIFNYDDFPVDWAMTQNNLALTYCERIRGDRAENIDQSIEHFNQALKIYTHQDFPVEWSLIQNNLGHAYWRRIWGDRAENLEKSIEHYYKALDVRKLGNFPVEWAETHNNLANSYKDRIKGERAENIEIAIEHLNKALKIRTYDDLPMHWADTQNNLGIAYNDRIKGHQANNIEKAIEHYDNALKVYSGVFMHQELFIRWAITQNNLATAYWSRVRGASDKNLEKAINHCYNALKIFRFESMPNDYRRVNRILGDLYFDRGQWVDSLESYRDAIKAGDILYLSGLSTDSKEVEVKENSYFHRKASMAACNLGSTNEALLILESGKTRLLDEALRLKMRKPDVIPTEEWIKYEQAAEKYRIATWFSSKEDYVQREKEAQTALEELHNTVKLLQKYDPMFLKELEISDVLLIPDKDTALITFCITDKGSIGYILTRSNGIQSVNIPGFNAKDLDNLLFRHSGQGSASDGWISTYQNYLHTSGTHLHETAFQSWKYTLNDVLSKVGTKLLCPLLKELSLQIKRLILLPTGGLSILPLHAFPLSDGQLLCQRYCISYAPSISLLREMQNKSGNILEKGLYAVINPEEDSRLVFSEYEGQTISKFFEFTQVDVGETGTKATVLDRISGQAYLHFSCHGSYNWNDPSQSGVFLHGGRTLSLADLQKDVVDMSSARLVTLSSCETGITDIVKGSADEFVGLPAGFMLAGVPCVVSSLWSVPDLSTALLMERFYSNHIKRQMDIPHSLQKAQLYVRDLTAKQVANQVEKCYQNGKWKGESKEKIEQYRERYLKMAEKSPEEKPFQHPYYWAAFTVNGA